MTIELHVLILISLVLRLTYERQRLVAFGALEVRKSDLCENLTLDRSGITK